MKYRHLQFKTIYQYHIPALLLSALVLCLVLLSACGSLSNGGNRQSVSSTPTALPTPAVDPTLQNQGTTELQTFQQWITLMQKYNGNTGTFQQQYTSDQEALQNAKTSTAYNAALSTLKNHVQAIQIPAMKTEGQSLQQQLQQGVTSFGQKHQYHDAYDNKTYPLGFEYGSSGMGGWLQDELSSARTVSDYQQAIEDANMWLTNFQAMASNSSDKTPYNQVHNSDLQLLQHYGMMNKKVIVISLEEQAMRVYQNGKLVNAFLVTTGRPDKPSLPGTWWVEGKQSPTVFKANVPQSSPYWYPDTPINYAVQYHSNGYFIHDSWWRADYGPGTQFPHQDASGDIYSAQGSHGCINMAKDNAAWVYGFVELYTHIVVY
ncbi:MAG TPA: L,D-transpeptidase [Ktedonobacteraceae bacterium]|nr:L,D-transpeptidase [Ktedonobacteraceae bacterium]